MIEPFFINNRLFACYHPPGGAGSQRLAVICPPLFDEYRRTYKALAELAAALAQAGLHVLRFDYEGTGDSAGELQDVTAQTWMDNIYQVIEEGIALTGAEKVSLIGVRVGANLAVNSTHSSVDRHVLWDPFPKGKDFLGKVDQINSNMKKRYLEIARNIGEPVEDIRCEYFKCSKPLMESLENLDCDEEVYEKVAGCKVIVSQPGCLNKFIEYSGYEYKWPDYHDGLFTPKQVLELLARKVLAI